MRRPCAPARACRRRTSPSTPSCPSRAARTAACGGRSSTRSAASTSRRLRGEDVCFSWRAQLGGFQPRVAEEALVHKRFRPSRLGDRCPSTSATASATLGCTAGSARPGCRGATRARGPARVAGDRARAARRMPERRAAGAACCRGPRSRAGGSTASVALPEPCTCSLWAPDDVRDLLRPAVGPRGDPDRRQRAALLRRGRRQRRQPQRADPRRTTGTPTTSRTPAGGCWRAGR